MFPYCSLQHKTYFKREVSQSVAQFVVRVSGNDRRALDMALWIYHSLMTRTGRLTAYSEVPPVESSTGFLPNELLNPVCDCLRTEHVRGVPA